MLKKVKVCSLYIKGFDSNILESSLTEIINTASKMGVQIGNPIRLPTKIKKYTVLRGPHVNKKAREQFEIRIYKRLLIIYNTDPKLVDNFLQFLQVNMFSSLSMKITKYRYTNLNKK